MTIVRLGGYATGCGAVLFGLGFILGAGPRNATAAGVLLQMLGMAIFPVGLIIAAVGILATEKKAG